MTEPFVKKRDNPDVSIQTCNMRHENLNSNIGSLNSNMNEVIKILRGTGEIDDTGLVGAVRDIRRDRKWIYALLTLLGIPTIFLIINFFMKGG